MLQTGERPLRGAVKDFLFGPAAGEEKGNAAQIHHANGVGEKRDRHDPAKPAHFANVLLMMEAVDDRAGTEKQERFEKAVGQKVHDARGDAADSERYHHQSQLRDGGISENAFDIELRQGDERSH